MMNDNRLILILSFDEGTKSKSNNNFITTTNQLQHVNTKLIEVDSANKKERSYLGGEKRKWRPNVHNWQIQSKFI